MLKMSPNAQRTMKTNARCTKTEDPPHTPSDDHKLAPLMSAIVGYVTASPPSSFCDTPSDDHKLEPLMSATVGYVTASPLPFVTLQEMTTS